MQTMEDLLWEIYGEDTNDNGLPPGFRFHPTDEELITFYLASKVFNGGFSGVEIVEVDLNRIEPWELPDMAKMGEREWYFFSLRDRKYPTGLRTNRATGAGYWKATGKDREVRSTTCGALVGMKKTLVFYRGRAPRGEKTKWVLHEYRLEGNFSCRLACKEEWVICRIFHKATAGDNKRTPFYPQNPTTISPPNSNSLFPSLNFQTLDQNPNLHSVENQQPYIDYNQEPSSLFPFPVISLPSIPPNINPNIQHEIIPISTNNWLENFLQNPFLYDMTFLEPIAGGESGPLVS